MGRTGRPNKWVNYPLLYPIRNKDTTHTHTHTRHTAKFRETFGNIHNFHNFSIVCISSLLISCLMADFKVDHDAQDGAQKNDGAEEYDFTRHNPLHWQRAQERRWSEREAENKERSTYNRHTHTYIHTHTLSPSLDVKVRRPFVSLYSRIISEQLFMHLPFYSGIHLRPIEMRMPLDFPRLASTFCTWKSKIANWVKSKDIEDPRGLYVVHKGWETVPNIEDMNDATKLSAHPYKYIYICVCFTIYPFLASPSSSPAHLLT